MRLGLDFRAMQLGHQFRGIGEVIRRGCAELDSRLSVEDRFVLFHDPNGPPVDDVLDGFVGPERIGAVVPLPYPRFGRLQKLRGGLDDGQEEIVAASCDVLLQFDFSLGVSARTPTVLVVYDQVPVLLGDRYPATYRPTYRGARRAGQNPAEAAKRALGREAYERNLAHALDRADAVLAISEHTASTTRDFAARRAVAGVDAKVRVAHLGHDPEALAPLDLDPLARARIEDLGLDTTPFVFFMGGADPRRRVDLLVAAFNQIRGRGRDLKLALAGYDFQSMDMIYTAATQDAIETSSYRDDIHLLGFVTPAERAWLYHHAEAFVFPTEHEGFGLPVIEAVATGCTVVAFDTTSIAELQGPNCRLCEPTWPALERSILAVLDRPDTEKVADATAGREWAAGFGWEDLGATLADQVDGLRGG